MERVREVRAVGEVELMGWEEEEWVGLKRDIELAGVSQQSSQDIF